MDFEKTNCPVVKINGVIERGKQYDLDITLPEDNRNVIYGIVKDCYKDPVCDAVVKLIEVECKMGKDIRLSQTKMVNSYLDLYVTTEYTKLKFG